VTRNQAWMKDEADHWVQLPGGFSGAPGAFVAQVIGESMNRRISNGAWCPLQCN